MEDKELIYIDDLTGIYNRRAFKENLEKDLSLPEEQVKDLYLALTDLDHFKKINDTYGHLSGDYMIKAFADALTQGLKGTDSLVARYGGDEFIVILRKMDKQNIINLLDKVRQDLAQKEFILPENNQSIKVTMSIGISGYPTDGRNVDDLFSQADQALYSSKRLGRNRLSLAKDILEQVKEEKRVEDAILKPFFVGRENEFNEAKKFLFGEETHKVVLIDGDVGVGKSRILNEIFAATKEKNIEAFLLVCSELQKDKPYGLLADIINAISHNRLEPCQKIYDSLKPKQKKALSGLPTLKLLTGSSEAITEWDADARLNLFQGLVDLLEHILNELKPVILIDNLDWIDEASVEILSYLIVSRKDSPLSLCASDSRPSSKKDKRESHLDTLLTEVAEFEIVPHITLPTLTEYSIRYLLNSIFGDGVIPDHFISNVCSVTRGNPFFITELLRDLLARNVVYLKYPEWVFNEKNEALPHDLKELLMSKFKSMDQEEKELLMAAAGLGGNLKFDFLSKLKNMNSGYLQDIIGNTADKNIFNKAEVGISGALAFNNEMTRALFYESIDEETKKKIHFDIATALENENKGSLESISSELAYHFNKANFMAKVKEYSAIALAYMDKLFSDAETEKIIEEAVRQREEKDKFEPIKDESWPFIMEIITSFNSAIKNMQSYQGYNALTDRMIEKIVSILGQLFKMQNNLTFCNPQGVSKDSNLVLVNGQEFKKATAVEETVRRRLVDILKISNIGSITFTRGTKKKDLEIFISILGNQKLLFEKKENWSKVLAENKISGLKIDTVLYKRILSEDEKNEFHKDFIKDFVSKKVAIEDVAGAGQNVQISLDKRIQGMSELEKNVFAKTIAHLPIDIIMGAIADEYKGRKGAILDIKDMVLVYIRNVQQKEQFALLLHKHLDKLGVSKECFSWLIDETDFLQYPVTKRANTYINTDAKTILEMGVIENLKPTLIELFSANEDEVAKRVTDKYLSNLQSDVAEFRVYMGNTLQEIVSIIPAKISADYIKIIANTFKESLKKESDATVYAYLIKNAGLLIYKFLELNDFENIDSLLFLLNEFAGAAYPVEWKRDLTQKALQEFDSADLNTQLAELMNEAAFDSSKNTILVSILKKLMPAPIPYLIDLMLKRSAISLPFEWYSQNLQIIGIFKEYKAEIVSEIEVMLEHENKVDLAFDLLKNFPDDNLLYFYEKALSSKKDKVHRRAVKALAELDTEASLKKVENIFANIDSDAQRKVIQSISEHGHSKQALVFLLRLKDSQNQAHNRKEILEAIEKLRTRSGG
ncbi:MAG: diguanylate cyclase [Candidatus Omnitrophota bacterium]